MDHDRSHNTAGFFAHITKYQRQHKSVHKSDPKQRTITRTEQMQRSKYQAGYQNRGPHADVPSSKRTIEKAPKNHFFDNWRQDSQANKWQQEAEAGAVLIKANSLFFGGVQWQNSTHNLDYHYKKKDVAQCSQEGIASVGPAGLSQRHYSSKRTVPAANKPEQKPAGQRLSQGHV